MSHKPAGLLYGVDETPPIAVNVLSGLQHVGLMFIYLVYPVLVAQAAGESPRVASTMVSFTLLAMAVGTLLQVLRFGPVGSGFLCQPAPSVVYVVPSLLAAQHGGLAAVFGMTIMAGAIEMALARVLPRLRKLFTPEITGLVVLLSGISVGVVGLRTAIGATAADASIGAAPDSLDLMLGLATLGLMVSLNVWGRGALRLYCVLIGLAAGCLGAWLLGRFDPVELARVAAAPALALPGLSHLGWTFEPSVALAFVTGAVAAVLKTIGNVTTSQKANQANWLRADMRTLGGGVMADGLANVVAGALGAHGINSSTGAVGLASATGVTSWRVGYSIAGLLLLAAFVPKLGLLVNLMPHAVLGAALVFSSTFIVLNGLVIMTSRLLDARKTLVIGLSIVMGLAVEIFPGFLVVLPPGLRASLGNAMVFGTLVGLALNLLFRIGLRKTVSMTVPAGGTDAEALAEFLEIQGGAWGARRDVIVRANFNLAQSLDALVSSGVATGPLLIEASFDEFNLDLNVSYDGDALELPQVRPSIEEIIESADGERRLAGFLLRRFADRVSSRHVGGRTTMGFHFDH